VSKAPAQRPEPKPKVLKSNGREYRDKELLAVAMRDALRWQARLARGLTKQDRDSPVLTSKPEFDPDAESGE
jgi:hypothetical protein